MELLVEEAKNYDNIEPREVPDRYPIGMGKSIDSYSL